MKNIYIACWLTLHWLICIGSSPLMGENPSHTAAIHLTKTDKMVENPEEAVSITFIVFAGEVPTTNAVITFGGTTNAQGNYLFTGILPGIWNYSVIHVGLLSAEGEISVTDQDLTIEIVLQPGTPEIVVNPTYISEALYWGAVLTVPLLISNEGNANLNYYIHIDPVRNLGHPGFPMGDNIMLIPNINAEPGADIWVNVAINNTDAFVAFQFDVALPSGFAYINGSAHLNPVRSNTHLLIVNILPGTNIFRALSFSLYNTAFIGNSGTVMSFGLTTPNTPGAAYPLILTGAIISNNNAMNILTGTINGYVLFGGTIPGNYLILGNIPGNTGSALAVNITINNIDEFVGFQFDIDLPEGFGFIPGSAALNNARRVDHQIQIEPIGSTNDIRITAFSPRNNAFLGTSGYVATLMVEPLPVPGSYSFQIENASILDFTANNILTATDDGTITLTKGWLSVSPLQGIIEPDTTHELDVIFHPEKVFWHGHSATIEIFSNDPAHPLVMVSVWAAFYLNSVGETEADHVLVYPVPAKDVLNIRVGKTTGMIRIYNQLGQKAWENTTQENEHVVIDLKNFEPGIWILQLDSRDGSTQSRKIVISK